MTFCVVWVRAQIYIKIRRALLPTHSSSMFINLTCSAPSHTQCVRTARPCIILLSFVLHAAKKRQQQVNMCEREWKDFWREAPPAAALHQEERRTHKKGSRCCRMAGCARPASPARGHGTRNSIETRVETFIIDAADAAVAPLSLYTARWWIIWLFQYLWAAANLAASHIKLPACCARTVCLSTLRYYIMLKLIRRWNMR